MFELLKENKVIKLLINNENNYFRIVNKYSGAVILLKYKDKYLLNKQFRPAINSTSIEFVRGYIGDDSENESRIEGAKREVLEELNIRVKDLVELGEIHTDSGIIQDNTILFCAEVESLDSIQVQSEEGIEGYLLLSEEELKEFILKNKIKDSFTISVFGKYLIYKERRIEKIGSLNQYAIIQKLVNEAVLNDKYIYLGKLSRMIDLHQRFDLNKNPEFIEIEGTDFGAIIYEKKS